MRAPQQHATGFAREPVVKTKTNAQLLAYEQVLRRQAYKNASIETGETFYNDSDMRSEYTLVVVYHAKSNTPLLSTRYYFDQAVISNYVNGNGKESILDVSAYRAKEIFLADRLSGNSSSALYRTYRDYVFMLLYFELYRANRGCRFILMARSTRNEKLLTKYIRIGLNVIGNTQLRGRAHWVLLGDLKKIVGYTRRSVFFNTVLLSKILFRKK